MSDPNAAQYHRVEDLMALFDRCFHATYNTRLVRGEDEPIYLPADTDYPFHRVVFAHGFFASGLHEVAHWCIAGEGRRQQVDYGYWYCPDGRSLAQQREFEQVEVKPQALEWIFSRAAGHRFRISVDNLSGEASDPEPFRRAVWQQVQHYCQAGLPARAEQFRAALAAFYRTGNSLQGASYTLELL